MHRLVDNSATCALRSCRRSLYGLWVLSMRALGCGLIGLGAVALANCTPDANFIRATTTTSGGAAGGGAQPSGGGGQGGGQQGGGGQAGGALGGGGQGPTQVLTVLKGAAFGGKGDDVLTDVAATDAALRIAGYSNSDPLNIGGALSMSGGYDALLVKVDDVWAATAESFGQSQDQHATALATTADGRLLIAGNFAHELSLGGQLMQANGSHDGFIGWFDVSSNHLASGQFGASGTQIDVRTAATLGTTAIAVIGGGFTGSDVTFNTTGCNLQGTSDLFLATFNVTAKCIWSRGFSGAATNALNAIVADSDHLYAVGSYSMGLSLVESIIANGEDGFVARLDTELGSTKWAKVITGDGAETPLAAAITAGDLLVTGRFSESIELGSTRMSAGTSDLFVARFAHQDGQLKWGKIFGDEKEQEATAIAATPNGTVAALAGTFSGTIDFGGAKLEAAPASKALFVAVLSVDTGAHIASMVLGDEQLKDAEATAVAFTPAGSIVVVGRYDGTLVLDSTTLGPSNDNDMFAIKLALGSGS